MAVHLLGLLMQNDFITVNESFIFKIDSPKNGELKIYQHCPGNAVFDSRASV